MGRKGTLFQRSFAESRDERHFPALHALTWRGGDVCSDDFLCPHEGMVRPSFCWRGSSPFFGRNFCPFLLVFLLFFEIRKARRRAFRGVQRMESFGRMKLRQTTFILLWTDYPRLKEGRKSGFISKICRLICRNEKTVH